MKRGKRGRGGESSPKHSLNLPDLDHAKLAVLNTLPSKESRNAVLSRISHTRPMHLPCAIGTAAISDYLTPHSLPLISEFHTPMSVRSVPPLKMALLPSTTKYPFKVNWPVLFRNLPVDADGSTLAVAM